MVKKTNIIHIVPTAYGGGVEAAANSFLKYSCENFIFKVIFLKNKKNEDTAPAYINAFKRIKRLNPDFILTSLWKSNLFTISLKLFKPKIKYILFLHSTKNKHFVDGLITTMAAFFAYEIWADSSETLIKRINNLYILKIYKNFLIEKNKEKIVSFILNKTKSLNHLRCTPSFIYWGRLCPDKNIDKAIKLFSKIYELDKKATFVIIGPDSGSKVHLHKQINRLLLKDNILILDFMSFSNIRKYAEKASFFIQLSKYEGMAMSVSESMQLGLVPIVTNVGQIKIYCKNMHNSLIYKNNDEEIIYRVFELIKSKKKYKNIRKNILNTWQYKTTYKEDLIKAFNKLF